MVRKPDFVDECYKNKNLSLLKKLTLIIPTFNRDYLKRCLWYHAHFPFGQIIVADSSFDEKKIENHESIANIRGEFGANILHLEYQPETEKYGGDIYRKWGDAVQHVETEYSIICTDKAFQNVDPLIEKIQFLDEHTDYVSAQGIWYYAEMATNNKIVCKIPMDFDEPISADDDDRFQRVCHSAVRKFNNKLFALIRSPIHKLIYQPILNGGINDIRYGEIALSILPVIWGKHKFFSNHFDLVRDIISLETKHGRNYSESSTLRYPEDLAYQKYGVLEKFYVDFQNVLIEQYKIVNNDFSADTKASLESKLKEAYYYPIRHPGLNLSAVVLRTKWLWLMWNRLPKRGKTMLYTIISDDKLKMQYFENSFTDLCSYLIKNYGSSTFSDTILNNM